MLKLTWGICSMIIKIIPGINQLFKGIITETSIKLSTFYQKIRVGLGVEYKKNEEV